MNRLESRLPNPFMKVGLKNDCGRTKPLSPMNSVKYFRVLTVKIFMKPKAVRRYFFL
jgi:hypothetical protein